MVWLIISIFYLNDSETQERGPFLKSQNFPRKKLEACAFAIDARFFQKLVTIYPRSAPVSLLKALYLGSLEADFAKTRQIYWGIMGVHKYFFIY